MPPGTGQDASRHGGELRYGTASDQAVTAGEGDARRWRDLLCEATNVRPEILARSRTG